jgi:hypothetical protein
MPTNMDRYKTDLDALIAKGSHLENAMQYECEPKLFEAELRKVFAEDPEATKGPGSRVDANQVTAKISQFLKALPSFTQTYQSWYSEAKALIRQLLPDRLADFARHYETPKPRKDITYSNYRIEDYLQHVHVTFAGEVKVGPNAAVPQFRQQMAILRSCKTRFESSLFEIRQLVQADLLDSELDAARELAKHKFYRAAGAVAGVVLEKHLAQVCANHATKIAKAKPTINDFNEALKVADVIDVPNWRFIQHLADIRNLCDHDRKVEPTDAQVHDLVEGVAKVSKTVF